MQQAATPKNEHIPLTWHDRAFTVPLSVQAMFRAGVRRLYNQHALSRGQQKSLCRSRSISRHRRPCCSYALSASSVWLCPPAVDDKWPIQVLIRDTKQGRAQWMPAAR